MPTTRRHAFRSLCRALVVAAAILVAYFTLPMERLDGGSVVTLLAGIGVVVVVLGWQIREITRSPFPRVRAVEALVTSLATFLVVFSTTYFVMGRHDPGNFSEPLTRVDSMYFTVTVFATVGFGDITAVTQPARLVVMVQMIGGFVVVGVVARMVVSAISIGLERRDRGHGPQEREEEQR